MSKRRMFRATHATLVGLYFLLLVNATAQTVSPPFTTPPEIPHHPMQRPLGSTVICLCRYSYD
ncbi:MAG: hypothetical protein AAFX57_03125 [Bacteroidota bacterium]